MLKTEDNELLCRVGRGTPMGEVFRRFWNPIALSDDVPPPDGTPLRLRILGENLVLFRDTGGEIGLLDEGCLHRRVSLALGRVEANGIRCLYHGWKFDVTGKVVDAPNVRDARVRERLKTRAYRTREAAGMLWAYMGPPEAEPPFPNWRFMQIPREHLKVVRLDSAGNYMQVLEGGTDSSHVGILHSNFARPGWMSGGFDANTDPDNPAALATDDLAPELQVEDTEFGFHYAALRDMTDAGDAGKRNVRIVPIVMPSTRIIPSPAMQFVVFEVPIDDEHTRSISLGFRTDGTPFNTARYDELRGRDNLELVDQATWAYQGSWDNRFGQKRDKMTEDWTGIRGVVMEDLAMALSPGPIVDRSEETLVASDAAVVRARRQLLESARRMRDGKAPFGVGADLSGVVACDATVSRDTRWQELVPGHVARVG